ncbi:MAG: hypothetical protein PHF56_14090 [Desulfuromonadaceae bacterium]|nr:hypothetical protein [Desulfuromonadaceae bacterium]
MARLQHLDFIFDVKLVFATGIYYKEWGQRGKEKTKKIRNEAGKRLHRILETVFLYNPHGDLW